ncbi:TMEM135 family protein [Abortiporus biennis]
MDNPPKSSTPLYQSISDYLNSIPSDHPLQISLRTYFLSLSLSLGPSLLPFILSQKTRRKGGFTALKHVLKREFGVSGFAFAMTAGVGGGAALKRLFDTFEDNEPSSNPDSQNSIQLTSAFRRFISKLSPTQKTFLANIISSFISISLLQLPQRSKTNNNQCSLHSVPKRSSIPLTSPLSESTRGRTSATLDLTLLLLVRALDSVFRSAVLPSSYRSKAGDVGVDGIGVEENEEMRKQKRQALTRKVDAIVFWACSARIMWCFFYEPQRLPRSYNKWIMSIANIDPRILSALRAIRADKWSYTQRRSDPADLVTTFSKDLGYPAAWGDPKILPPYGGEGATKVWEALGVQGRNAVGGLPCEIVHGGLAGHNCYANAGVRGLKAFGEALAIYLPVHVLPILLTRPQKLLQLSTLLSTLLNILRSASFLSTFVSSIWFTVCFTRTIFLAKLFPWISHDFWDGPFGCTFLGSLVCGSSIWIEQGRRRGEMALYVLPRAIRACLSEKWLKSGKRSVKFAERLTFVLSLAILLTSSSHAPDSLRGLSRWTLAFVMKGPSNGFWKTKRKDTGTPSTPTESTEPSKKSDEVVEKLGHSLDTLN